MINSRLKFLCSFSAALLAGASCGSVFAQNKSVPIPKSLDANWKIELVDSEPNIVTPTACDTDKNDNLYVVECHTHFPADNYPGPKTDRIWVYIDADHDGSFEKRELFYEGGIATMSLVCDSDGWVYVSSRSQIIRLKDDNKDFKADQNQQIIKHDTKANYPHNGLSSLMLVGKDELMFGQGENFGDPYRVVGTDDSFQAGGGEGGNVYICKRDGSKVRRFATGFWNPFGQAMFKDNLFIVDNDPDATPPNRLLRVIESGDYGFQFRFGRAGTNPLLAWNGNYPGTMGMAAGVGEAACAVQPVGNSLLVSSWGDNRIERFANTGENVNLGPAETLVQGSSMFRPVDFAVNSKGVIYVTDWVDRDYKVHGKGRIWKLTHTKSSNPSSASSTQIGSSSSEIPVGSSSDEWHKFESALNKRSSQNAARSLSELVAQVESELDANKLATSEQMADLYGVRWKWLTGKKSFDEKLPDTVAALLKKCLSSSKVELRLMAIRFAAESGDKGLLPAIEARLKAPGLDYERELGPMIAAISYLSAGQAAGARLDPARELVLKNLLLDKSTAVEVQTYAMSQLSPAYKDIDGQALASAVAQKQNEELTHHWIAWLAASGAKVELVKYLSGAEGSESNRADAVAALASIDSKAALELYHSSKHLADSAAVKAEVVRVEHAASLDASQFPDRNKVEAWMPLVSGKGNKHEGWRVWIRSQCVKCHALDGRGATVGPDLAAIARGSSQEQLLTSILQPSKEIAPLFVTWKVLTADGKVILGSKVNGGGVGESNRYLLADGTTVDIAQQDIEEQEPVSQSIMPDNVAQTLSIDELADLMAMFESYKKP